MAIKIKKLVRLYFLMLAGSWTVLITFLAAYQLSYVHSDIIEMAVNEARIHFNRDQAFRLWGASHGGVYVPIDEQTPSNEHLVHIKERDIETPAGRRLTLMNPAYMVRQMGKMYSDLYGVIGHITSLKPLRPANAPDEWERNALESFEKGKEELIELKEINNESYMRFMKPVTAEAACLKCHGHQGYKEGDIRGGISVSIPMAPYLTRERKEFISHILSYGLIWTLGLLGIGIGLKWRKRRWHAEEALHKSEESLARAQQIAHLGNWDWDIAGNELWWSDEIYRIFGLAPQEFGGTQEAFLNSVHPDDRGFVVKSINDALFKRIDYSIDHRIVLPDGIEKIVHEQAEVHYDNTKPVRMVGTVQDVTGQKKMEEVLRNIASGVLGTTSEEVLHSLVKYLALALEADYAFIGRKGKKKNTIKTIAVYGEDKILDNFEYDLKGSPCEKALGEDVCFYPSEVRQKFPKDRFLTKMGLEGYLGAALVDSAGNRFGLISALSCKPFKNIEAAETLLKIFTVRAKAELERERVEKEKQELWKQLLQSQKMESIGRLTGGVAHDFNNLLTGIIGYSELAVSKKVKAIEESGEKAAELTRQLLAFSRKQVLEMNLTNMTFIIENMTKMLPIMIGEDVKLEIKAPKLVKNMMADEIQIEQVLMNLAVNARHAMPRGGRLTIETKNVEIDEKCTASHQGVKPGRYIMLSVADTGIGINPEMKEKIFEPFFTTREEGKGTGLGLSTVFGIVKQHDGYISVDSEPGKGSVFKVYLPAAEGKAKEKKKKEPVVIKKGTETVLVVDEDSTIRSLVVDTLKPLGYKVLLAKNSGDALDVIDKNNGTIALLLIDVVMKGMNGWNLAEKVRSKWPDKKMVFISGYIESPIVQDKIQSSGLPFIKKPFKPNMLANKLREALDEK
jgi:PAS domain S-box-containing protein